MIKVFGVIYYNEKIRKNSYFFYYIINQKVIKIYVIIIFDYIG